MNYPSPSSPSSPVDSTHSEGKHKRDRIKSAGVAILETFYRDHQRQPTHHEALDLLARIHATPGCQNFAIDRLFVWFKRRKKPDTISNPFYPSLTPESIHHLKILCEGQDDPSTQVINTWAILLKASTEDIVSWIQDNKLFSEEHSQHPQVPTPVLTSSPEPMRPKPEPTQSPLLLYTTPNLAEAHSIQQTLIEADVNKILLDAITDTSRGQDAVPHVSPGTASDFVKLFSSYQEKMETMLKILS
ncbi:hypothetical protein AX17_002571 [Amanita inopinata Kibby_2008]|nr:hypothetical protein AX17_002571 [Amanita inopinata Kibby_2008]